MERRNWVTMIFALALCFGLQSLAIAQQSQETPESVAKAYMEASRQADWIKAASYMHPDALKQLRDLFAPLVAATKSEKEKLEMEGVLGVKDKAEFDKLSDAEVFGKLLGFMSSVTPELKNVLNSSMFDILGNIQESADLTHILYRMTIKVDLPGLKEPISMTKLEVISMRRFETSWRAELSGDLQGMAKAMAAGLAAREAEEEPAPPPPPAPKKQPVKKKPVRKP